MRIRLVVAVVLFASFGAVSLSAAAPTSSAPPYGTMWTVDSSANSLSEYAAGASGTDAPIATIKGTATGLHAPSAVAISATGKLFVANAGNDSITEYPVTASGNAAPLTTISGSNTGLDAPSSIALTGGAVWVTNPASNLVESFTAGSDGNVLPAETIAGHKTELDHPTAIAVSNDFEPSIAVINTPTSGHPNVLTYFTDKRGNIAPDTVTTGKGKHKLVDPTAIMSGGFGVYWVADAGSNSLSLILSLPGLGGGEVVHTVSGANTGLDDPTGLTLDAFDHVIVTNAGDHSVRVFSAHVGRDARPIRTLTGVGTATGQPTAAAVFGIAPGNPTDLKVKLHGPTATMSWKPPAVTGGGIVGYQVSAFREDGAGGILRVLTQLLGGGLSDLGGVTTTKTSFTKHNIKPGHRYLFAVEAVNGFGTSGSSRPVRLAEVIAPSAPRHVRVLTGPHTALVSWKAPRRDGGANDHYRVQYAAGCVPGAKGCKTHHVVSNDPFGSPSTKLKSLKAHTTYDIRVTARNKAGTAAAKVVKATTQ